MSLSVWRSAALRGFAILLICLIPVKCFAQPTVASGFEDSSVAAVAYPTALAFVPALTLGIMCNALVCLSSWMCYGARTTVDRVVTIVPPIAAFVAAGFEHSIANAYYMPLGLFIKAGAPDSFWAAIHRTPADFPALTWGNFLLGNLLPVTIGNIIGGSIMVAAVYWVVYLRKKEGPLS